jgi:putative nucleotidyltransferase with HDIG domain
VLVVAQGSSESVDSYVRQIRRSEITRKWSMIKGAAISAEAGSSLAAHIEDHSRDVVASVLRALGRDQRTGSIASSVFANTFLDQLAAEIDGGDRDGLDAWCNSAPNPQAASDHARLVVLTCAALAASYTAKYGPHEEVFTYLALRGSELAKRIESARPVGKRAAVDPSKLVSQDEVVASLLAAVDARDSATCDHSRAVGAWCRRIGKAMGLNAEQQEFASLCGILHDVGKVSTPLSILVKPGPLTDDEWVTMRAHSRIGAKMLERIPSLKEVAPIIRAHHERIDGKGYPDRLSGNQIPLMARIIAVADSFHAMISKRPYRDPVPIQKAVEILAEGSGTQWDPVVVDAMLSIIRPARQEVELRVIAGGRGA